MNRITFLGEKLHTLARNLFNDDTYVRGVAVTCIEIDDGVTWIEKIAEFIVHEKTPVVDYGYYTKETEDWEVVHQEGFEPSTFPSVAERSNPLSYKCMPKL